MAWQQQLAIQRGLANPAIPQPLPLSGALERQALLNTFALPRGAATTFGSSMSREEAVDLLQKAADPNFPKNYNPFAPAKPVVVTPGGYTYEPTPQAWPGGIASSTWGVPGTNLPLSKEDAILKAAIIALGLTQPEALLLLVAWEGVKRIRPSDPLKRNTYTYYDIGGAGALWYIWPDGTAHNKPVDWPGYQGKTVPLTSISTGVTGPRR